MVAEKHIGEGKTVKAVDVFKELEEKNIYKYEYEFDNVKDDIFIEPDINQYEPYI